MSDPTAALYAHDLLHDQIGHPAYAAYMTNFMEDVARKTSGVCIRDAAGQPSGPVFVERERTRLALAETYFLDRELMPVVRWAAAGLSSVDRFARDVWPSDHGFLWLDEARLSTETWGRTVTSKAFSWGRTVGHTPDGRPVPGVLLVGYTDINDDRDEINLELRGKVNADRLRQLGRLHVQHVTFISDDQRVGPEYVVPPADYARWADAGQTLAPEADNELRFLLAFLLLLEQRITDVDRPHLPRTVRRRMDRAAIPGAITVVKLRRVVGHERGDGESAVEWAHRFIVGSHWRWQPYGPRACAGGGPDHTYGAVEYDGGNRAQFCSQPGCDARLERIFISAYMKNAEREDLPIKQSRKVRSLVR